MNMMMDGWSMMSMMIFMFLSGLLLVTVFVAIVVLLVKSFLGSKLFPANERDNALEILRTRYAKGEIGREEFEAMRRDIKK